MKKMISKTLSMLLVIAMITSVATVAATAAATTFSDVNPGDWFYDDVTRAANNGVVSGVGDNKFDPNGKLTYAQVFSMLVRTFYPNEKSALENDAASLVEMDAYFDGDVSWWSHDAYYLNVNGLLDGTDVNIKSSASANAPITRLEMVQIANNILRRHGVAISSSAMTSARKSIADWSSVPSKYHDAVQTCYGLRIVTGMGDGSFNGTGTLTRAQACVIVNSLLVNVANGPSELPLEYCTCSCEACNRKQPTEPETPQPPQPPVSGETEIKVTLNDNYYYNVADNGFSTGKLNNGLDVTTENVAALLAKAQKEWPNGLSWTNSGTPNNHWYVGAGSVSTGTIGKYVDTTYACGGYAAMISDFVFGKTANPARQTTVDKIRPGDIIVWKQAGESGVHHVMVATSATFYDDGKMVDDAVTTTDGNNNDKVNWENRSYGESTSLSFQNRWNPGKNSWEVWTRYPD